jgi:hypothetical protein
MVTRTLLYIRVCLHCLSFYTRLHFIFHFLARTAENVCVWGMCVRNVCEEYLWVMSVRNVCEECLWGICVRNVWYVCLWGMCLDSAKLTSWQRYRWKFELQRSDCRWANDFWHFHGPWCLRQAFLVLLGHVRWTMGTAHPLTGRHVPQDTNLVFVDTISYLRSFWLINLLVT